MIAKTTLLGAALLAASGCSLPYSAEDLAQANVCESDSDCGDGSICASVGGESTCVARSFDLADVVFEVRPTLVDGTMAASSLIVPLGWPQSGGSNVIDLNLELPPHVDVSPGQVFLPCAKTTPVPAKITFYPVSHLAGLLEGEKYEAASVVDDTGMAAIDLELPQGTYDIHIQPDITMVPDCLAAPPVFFLGRDITVKKPFEAKAPLRLEGTLKLSKEEDFTQWYLEVVEPLRGQTISEVVQPKQVGIALEVPFQVWFDWTEREAFTPVIRLRPPAGSSKPVIHWRLDAVALQGVVEDKVPVKLDVSKIVTKPRAVEGHVLKGTSPAAATVTLRSLSVSKVELARFETVVETDEFGHFASAVPPGNYQVIARPHDPGLAAGVATWDIAEADDCFCANSVQVPAATTLAGSVSTPSGDPADVEVRLTPAATSSVAYLATVIGSEVEPRPASTFAQNGQFQVSVDGGYFDLSVIAPRGSGYPWLVRPNLFITPSTSTAATPVVSLEPFQLQDPVVVQGLVLDPQKAPLGGATVRAWLPVGEAPYGNEIAKSAVQIGEAVTAEDGTYVLLLPPSIQ